MQKTIFYSRIKSASTKPVRSVTLGKPVTFDDVTGLGLNVNHPYSFAWKHDNAILWGNAALNKMAEVGYFDTVPVLPELPPGAISTTIWHPFPAENPSDFPLDFEGNMVYRCHIKDSPGTMVFIPWNEQYAPAWTTLGVFEFNNQYKDNNDYIHNPEYDIVKVEWEAALQEWIEMVKRDFVLHQNYIQITPAILPDTTSNKELKLEPGGTLWKWYENDKNGKEITVARGQYYCPPGAITDTNHPRYLSRAMDMKDTPVIARMQQILNT
jgi:hypothetical protein